MDPCLYICDAPCYAVCLIHCRGKGDAERLCGMDCPGRQGVPPSLHCEMCMCMFHPECVGYSDRAARGGFICKVSLFFSSPYFHFHVESMFYDIPVRLHGPSSLIPCSSTSIALLPTQCSSLRITFQYRFPIFLFLILSSFVTTHVHRGVHISATYNSFSCAFCQCPCPYTIAGQSITLKR